MTWETKLPASSETLNEDLIVAKLEELTQPEWRQLIDDVVERGDTHSQLVTLFGEDRSLPIIVQVAQVIGKIGGSSETRFSNAADELIRQLLSRQNSGDALNQLDDVVTLLGLVRFKPAPVTLISIVRDRALPAMVRRRAAGVLADSSHQYGEPGWGFWQSLDVNDDEPLLAPYVAAIAVQDPPRGLRTLDSQSLAETAFAQAESAYRVCTNMALTKGGPQMVRDCYDAMGPDGRRRLEVILALDEFTDTANAIFTDIPSIGRTGVGKWPQLVQRLSTVEEVELIEFGFDGARIWDRNAATPAYLHLMRLEFLKVVRAATRNPNLRADFIQPPEISKAIDEIAQGTAFCAEPIIFSPARRDRLEIVPVGSMTHLALVGAEQDLDAVSSRQLHPTLSGLVTKAILEDKRIYCQEDTAAHEELNRAIDTVRNDWPPEKLEAVLVPMQIKPAEGLIDALTYIPSTIALLDLPIGARIRDEVTRRRHGASARRSKSTVQCRRVAYDDPIRVGFPYPLDDPEFQARVLDIVRAALLQGGQWREAFRKFASDVGITLDDPPHLEPEWLGPAATTVRRFG